MTERKSSFAEQYSHVWISGSPGVFVAHLTVGDTNTAESLVSVLFEDNCIADANIYNEPSSKTFTRDGREIISDGETRLILTTSDDRIADVLKVAGRKIPDKNFDLVYHPVATGNKEYISWVGTN